MSVRSADAASGDPGRSISADEKRRQLDRILDYPGFEASGRRRAMLKFIVEETLAGRSAAVKGSVIATEVFGRGADFDPAIDPVVRLEARKLRRDLDSYYVGAGRHDPVRIEIPKGKYIPIFVSQRTAASNEEPMVADAERAAPVEPKASLDPQPDRRLRRPVPFALALATFLGAVLVSGAYFGEQRQSASKLSSIDAKVTVDRFETEAADDLSSLLAAGLSHDVSAALLRFSDIRVHRVAAPKNPETVASVGNSPPPETQFTVSGTILRDADTVVVRAELRRNADSELLWSERYLMESGEGRLFRVSNEISAKIATVVGQQYGVVRSEIRNELLSDPSNPSLETYACISRATLYRRTLRAEEYWETRHCLEDAVLDQPDYARGWAMLAYLLNDASRFGYEPEADADELLSRARAAAGRALTLDPQDTDALKALSHIEHYAGHFDLSIDYAQRAIASNPNDPETIGNLGVMLGFQGRFAEATPFLKRAIGRSISPAPRYYQFLAMAYMMNEDWEEMLDAASYAVADGSGLSFFLAAISNAALGNSRAAQENFEKSADLWPHITENPRAALTIHKVAPALVDAFAEGLERVRAALPD